MKKIFSLAIVIMVATGMASAQDYVIVETSSGNTTSFKMEDTQSVTFTENTMNDGWTSLGYCLYGEDFFASTLYMSYEGDLCCEYYVEVQESVDNPGLYRLVNPYSPDIYPFADVFALSDFTYDSDNNYYIEIDATNPVRVIVDYFDTGVTCGSLGSLCVYSEACEYYYQSGYTWNQVELEDVFGTLTDGVITFPGRALLTYLPAYLFTTFEANLYRNFKLDLNDKSDKPGKRVKKSVSFDGGLSFNEAAQVPERKATIQELHSGMKLDVKH